VINVMQIVKLKHWRGSPAENARKGAPMLGFGMFSAIKAPSFQRRLESSPYQFSEKWMGLGPSLRWDDELLGFARLVTAMRAHA
jgi:hypothetical protein